MKTKTAADLIEEIEEWSSIVIPSSPPSAQSQAHQSVHKKQKGSKGHKNASSTQSQAHQTGQQSGSTGPDETIDVWNEISIKFQIAQMVHAVYRESVRTENNVRCVLSYAIVGIFVVWALFGLYYLMFQNGNIQVLVTGSAFITGPLGVVIGYFFGRGDTGWNG